jgi:tetratricopeptide (TPR) repeat protein
MKVAACVVALLVGTACGSQDREASGPPSTPVAEVGEAPLPDVHLPDLAGMAPPVQRQIQDHHSRLVDANRDPSATPERRADAYAALGQLLLAADVLAEAETCLRHAVALSPRDGRWTYLLAHVYRLQGEAAPAATYFERTLQASPDDPAALVWLGNGYLDQGRTEEARLLFTRALILNSRVAAARVGLGRIALAMRDFAQAIEHLTSALAQDPSATSIHYLLASALVGAGRPEEAEVHLRQRGPGPAYPPDPVMERVGELLHSPTAFEGRGDGALARGDFARAARVYRAGLDLDPTSLTLRQKLATSLSLSGDVAGGVRELQELLRRSPTFASAHYTLGALHLRSGQTDLAIERFRAAVTYDPAYLQARLQLGNALWRSGRHELAREQYRAVLDLDPRVPEGHLGEALALVGLGRHQAARDRLSEAVRLFPDRWQFVSALARLHAASADARVRDGDRALALARALMRLHDSADAREVMAMALAETGAFGEALMWQRDAMAADRSGDRDTALAMAANLTRFERREPSRVPWRIGADWEQP